MKNKPNVKEIANLVRNGTASQEILAEAASLLESNEYRENQSKRDFYALVFGGILLTILGGAVLIIVAASL